jgi:predicted transcriptional regulator
MKNYDEGMAANTVSNVPEDMVKVVTAFNALKASEKSIVLASLGEVQDASEEAKMIQEIVSYRSPDYKGIFIELIKNNAKLSWATLNTDAGKPKEEDWTE